MLSTRKNEDNIDKISNKKRNNLNKNVIFIFLILFR